jgi:hypothetical protein
MKRIFILLFTGFFSVFIGFFSSCNEKEEEPKNPFRENIIGQWKLNKISFMVDGQEYIITDYSEENIVFDFQEKNKLVVYGSISNDLGLFDDFQEGERFYSYVRYDVDPLSCVGPNFSIYYNELEYGKDDINYYCYSQSDGESLYINTMQINREINGVVYRGWSLVCIN